MVRQPPQQQHQVSDIPDYDPGLTPFQATSNATSSNTSISSNCRGRYFVLPLSIPNTPVHTKISSIIQSKKKAQYDAQQKYREWYMAYKEATLARKKTLELGNKLNDAKQKMNDSMKEVENEKEKLMNKLNDVTMKRRLPPLDVEESTNLNDEEQHQRPRKKQKNNIDDTTDIISNDNNKESISSKKKKKNKSPSNINSSSESSGKLKQLNGDDDNDDDDLESLKLKHEKAKSELDSLHRTKSHFIWLLKQVITAENKRKEEKDKKKELKLKNKCV